MNTDKIKVVHFVQTIKRGGSERQLSYIVQYSSQIDHHVLTLNYSESNYVNESYKLICIKSRNILYRIVTTWRYFRLIKPDIVFAWGALTYLIAMICSCFQRVIVINGSIRHGVFNHDLQAHFRKAMLHCSKIVVANSVAGLRANKLRRGIVLYNGIPISSSLPISERPPFELLPQPKTPITFVSLANLVPIKDYETIFKALKLLDSRGISFRYLIMGDGPQRRYYEDLANRMGLSDRIVFLGNIADTNSRLHDSDIFIHSSRGEGCPNAILEAMQMGLPIVATNTGGTPEVLDQNARLFDYGDHQGLAQALMDLIDNPEERTRMGRESQETVLRRFSIDRMIKDYEGLISAVYKKNTRELSRMSKSL